MVVREQYIVSGGADIANGALNTVAKYDRSGLVESMPSLKQRRSGHACSSFFSDSGESVGFML